MSRKKKSKKTTAPETAVVSEETLDAANASEATESAEALEAQATPEAEVAAEADLAPTAADDLDATDVNAEGIEVVAADTAATTDEDSNLIERAHVEGLELEFADDDAESIERSDDDHAEDIAFVTADDDAEDTDSADALAGEGLAASADGDAETDNADDADLSGTELDSFESAEIEDVEVLTAEQIRSVTESILFATDKPLSLAVIKQAFKGTNVKSKDLREALKALQDEYATSARGFTLDEVGGGFQLRTKADNVKYLRNQIKARPFKLSGPALEVMSIVAYKQPVTKAQMDEIRGVESGHLLRALMEKHLVSFGERSDLPGKPMFYETTRKFLEIFGLRNLSELPSLAEIDQLIPEGIGEVEDKETLSDLTGQLSNEIGKSYSEAEDELLKITDELTQISTSSEFFEQEKQRLRDKRDEERAQNIRDAVAVGEAVDDKDRKWLERYEAAKLEREAAGNEAAFVAAAGEETSAPSDAIEAGASDASAAGSEELADGEELAASEEGADESVQSLELSTEGETLAFDDIAGDAAEFSDDAATDEDIAAAEQSDAPEVSGDHDEDDNVLAFDSKERDAEV